MVNKINKIHTAFLVFFACSFLFAPHKASALLGIDVSKISSGIVGGAIDSAFTKLGVDQQELKYMIKTANVSRRKKQQPQMELSLSPENPVSGQKVSAVAMPMYFFNTQENLYYTWYLKPNGCPDRNSSASPERCDFDRDNDIDINDYKVKAARILAGNDFEWEKADYGSGNPGKSYSAIWGGDDQNEKENHCFIHDVNSGDEYEIECNKHLFPETSSGGQAGNGTFNLDYERFFHTDPNDPDTADTGNGDEANLVGLGMNTFSWNYEKGDKVGVVIEGISDEPTQNKNSSYKIMWAFVNNKCDIGTVSETGYPDTSTSSAIESVDLGIGSTCPGGGSTTTKKVTTTVTESIVGQAANTATIRTTSYKTDITDSDCNGLYDEPSGSAYDQSTTCPSGPDYDSKCLGITCYGDGFDKDVVLNMDDLFSDRISKASDLNKCLYDNFLDPAEGGGSKTKMDISLSYSPDFPMNDSPSAGSYDKNGNGDELTIQSSITNADNLSYLKYAWQIYESNQPNPDSWGEPISKTRLPDDLLTTGVGLNSLKIRLNIPDLKKYLKVKLTVTEVTPGDTRKGVANVVIPISDIQQRIEAYSTNVTSNLSFSRGSVERCTHKVAGQEVPDAICLVAKDEIIALSVDNNNGEFTDFLWTVNNEALQPPNSQEPYGNTAFFPVLEDNGYRYTVGVAATNKAGDKIDLVKTFEVADPKIQVASADEYVCKPNLLGYYIDTTDATNQSEWPDYSTTNFSAVSDTQIKLKAEFTGFIPTQDQYVWYIDGYEINKSNAASYGYSIDGNGVLTLTDKPIGSNYTATAGYLFSQDKNTKKALTQYWGVTMDKFYEKKIASTINIEFVGSISDAQGAGKNNLPKKIIASIYSSTPAYIAFLLRIVLTTFALLIFSRIILSFFPNLNKNEY